MKAGKNNFQCLGTLSQISFTIYKTNIMNKIVYKNWETTKAVSRLQFSIRKIIFWDISTSRQDENLDAVVLRVSEKAQIRSSRSLVFFKIGVLKNFAIFTGKYLCCFLSFIKLQAFRPATLSKKDFNTALSCEYCEIFKSTSFTEYLWCLLLTNTSE